MKVFLISILALITPAICLADKKPPRNAGGIESPGLNPTPDDSTGIHLAELADSAAAAPSREEELLSQIENLKQQCDFFKGYYVKEIRKSVDQDRKYLGGKFADIKADEISVIADRYSPCAEDPEFTSIIALSNTTLANKKIYESATYFVAEDGPDFSPSIYGQLTDTLSRIQTPVSEAQAAEIQDLKDIAELYPIALKIFKERITDIREGVLDREGAAASKNYAASIKSVDLPRYLDTNEVKREYQYVISRVPKLKAVYDTWTAALRKNFMDPKVISMEDHVLSLKIEEDGVKE